MKSFKSFLVVLFTLIYTFYLSSSVCAAENEIDFARWNSVEEAYLLTNEKTPSHSSLKNAVLKLIEDEASHRMTILFMLEFYTYTDISNVNIIMTVNGGEEIIIHTDKDAEYNEDQYFVSTVTHEQPQTKMIYMQTILGIKDGLPDKKELKVQVRDTEGMLSNRYTVNIPGKSAEDATQTQTFEATSKTKPVNKTKKPAKTDKADKSDQIDSVLTSPTEDSVTVRYTEKENTPPTLSTGKVVGSVTGVTVLILSAGYGLSHLIKSKQQKRGEG